MEELRTSRTHDAIWLKIRGRLSEEWRESWFIEMRVCGYLVPEGL